MKRQILKMGICIVMILMVAFSMICDFSTPLVYAEGSTVTPLTLTADDLKVLSYGTSGGSVEEFYKKHLFSAYKLYLVSGMSPALTIGQLAQESGWGSSSLATKFKNYWGMKCNYSYLGWTHCKAHGVTHYESDAFKDASGSWDTYRSYYTMDAAFMDRPEFFYERSPYPNVTNMMKDGRAASYKTLLSDECAFDWNNYCPNKADTNSYRRTLKSLIEGRQRIDRLDDEAYMVAMLEYLGLYKNGDPIEIGGKVYYPGTKSVYTGEPVVVGTNTTVGTPSGGSNIAYPDSNDFIIIKPGEVQKIELSPVEQLKYDEYKAISNARDYLSNTKVLSLPRAVANLLIWGGAIILMYCLLLFIAHLIDISAGGLSITLLTFLTFGRMRSISNAMVNDVPKKDHTGKLNISTRQLSIRLCIAASIGILCWQIDYVMYLITLIYLEAQNLLSFI